MTVWFFSGQLKFDILNSHLADKMREVDVSGWG